MIRPMAVRKPAVMQDFMSVARQEDCASRRVFARMTSESASMMAVSASMRTWSGIICRLIRMTPGIRARSSSSAAWLCRHAAPARSSAMRSSAAGVKVGKPTTPQASVMR